MSIEPRSPADATRRVAAIDIGSNSIRLVVADALPGGQFRIIDEERRSTRLVRQLGTTGRLDEPAIDETIEGLRHFKKLLEGLEVREHRTIATCAVREAANGVEFVRRAEDEANIEVEVISSEEEALFAFRSVQRAFDISDRNVAVVDIGGGSTEVVFASAGHVEKIYSTRLGAVRMTELFGTRDTLFGEDCDLLLSEVERELKRVVKKRPFIPQIMYGTGGTFTALASMIIAARKEDTQMLWGYRVTRADVRHMLNRLSNLSPKARRNIPGLNSDRADIIVAGLAIIDRVMVRLRTNILRVHTGGVREGLLLSMTESMTPARQDEGDSTQASEQFAASCGADLAHARHVAKLAIEILDQLHGVVPFTPADRRILNHAAILQDVGYLINYKQHHQHSYQLIVNSNLPGLRRHELELIANVARYHRGALPKNKHVNYRKLPKDVRLRVLQLSTILRLAGALDRGYLQRVNSVAVEVFPERVALTVHADEEVDLELWSARGKGELFEKVFGRSLSVLSSHGDSTPLQQVTSGNGLREAHPGSPEPRSPLSSKGSARDT